MPYPIIDESGKIWVNNSDGDITLTDKVFGNGSYLQKSGSAPDKHIYTAAHSSLTIDSLWTLDFRLKLPDLATGLYIEQSDGDNFFSLSVNFGASTFIDCFYMDTVNAWEIYTTGSENISLNAWHHVAIVRYINDDSPPKNVGLIYVDGNKMLQNTSFEPGSIVCQFINAPFMIFPYYTVENIYLDEFRFSNGVARWPLPGQLITDPFTPPASAYGLDEYTKILLHFDVGVATSGWSIQNPNI